MPEGTFLQLKKLQDLAGGCPPEAFEFIRQGLDHTVRTLHGENQQDMLADPESKHVNGQQLCLGLREFAIDRYGMLARTVLDTWGIHRTDDFGRIVFAMIEAGLMRKSDEDTLDDFRSVYEFDEAFDSAL